MNNRDVAIDIYNRLNRWSHGALTDFAVGIIEDELDMAFPYEQINRNKTLLEKVNRVEVIDQNGRSYVNWKPTNKTEINVQDDGKTLKVFISN